VRPSQSESVELAEETVEDSEGEAADGVLHAVVVGSVDEEVVAEAEALAVAAVAVVDFQEAVHHGEEDVDSVAGVGVDIEPVVKKSFTRVCGIGNLESQVTSDMVIGRRLEFLRKRFPTTFQFLPLYR
jgi:hypothetical protein